jgi:ribosome-associated heat shock protein Hsp15
MSDIAKVRLDKYLWAIRLYKTRSQATKAIDAGKVKLHGVAIKPSRIAAIGDQYDIKTEARKWLIEVKGIIDTRVAYSEAIKHYADLTPPELIEAQKSSFSFPTGKRMSKTGRPTKKDMRNLSDLNAGWAED